MNLNGKVKSLKIFQYKAVKKNGIIEKEKIQNSEGVAYVDNQFLFNHQGMITEHKQYISDKLTHRFTYLYDNDLNISNKNYYNSKGELVNESTFENTQNSKGELIEEKEFMTGKGFETNWNHKIFIDQNEVKEINYSDNEIYQTREYIYNKKGNLIQENWNSQDGTLYIKTLTIYNDKGQRIQATVLDSKDELISREEYKYLGFDTQNNWTKIIIYENNKPINIIEAEIKYYK